MMSTMMPELPKNDNLSNFIKRAHQSIETAASFVRFHETRQHRVLRKFSITEVCEFLQVDRRLIQQLSEIPNAPEGELVGRERQFTLDEVMRIRILLANRKNRWPAKTLHWRAKDQPIPIIVVSSQKGGSAKTLTTANLGQFLNVYHGLRVGVVDADSQASLSLYFSSDKDPVARVDANTYTDFMGIGGINKDQTVSLTWREAEELDTFWTNTPWPGIRLIPGGPSISEAEVALHLVGRGEDERFKTFYRIFHDALRRWEEGHPVRTDTKDLVDENGSIREDVYQAAMKETLDVIIIDCAPTLSLSVLNAIVAADMLIVPQPMKGFDLSTLSVFLGSAASMLEFVSVNDPTLKFRNCPSLILPTIVSPQSDTDLKITGELYSHDPEIVCPIFYSRSESVANAAEHYQSIYEYVPPKSRRQSAQTFLANANAVNDAIASRALPWIPARGYANRFLEETFGPGVIAPWTKETE